MYERDCAQLTRKTAASVAFKATSEEKLKDMGLRTAGSTPEPESH